jgi:hypothetical protein
MDIDDSFIAGIKTANANFWEANADSFVTSAGITAGFSRELGESMFAPQKSIRTPFYNLFSGRPLKYGASWKERILAMPSTERFNPKATAQQAFGFYDSEGLEAVHASHYQGWIPLTVPSDLELSELVQSPAKIGEFANYIYDNGSRAVQMDIDALIGKKLVSCVEHTDTIDTSDFKAFRKKIRDVAAAMRTNQGNYVSSTVDPDKYITSANEVIVLMEEVVYNDMVSDLAVYPSPDKIVQGATIIPIPEMPTPITTAEYTAGVTSNGWDEDTPPANLGADKPTVMILSKDFIEWRPYIQESKVNLNANGAGDFTNAHILFKGSIGIRGWENALALTAEPVTP